MKVSRTEDLPLEPPDTDHFSGVVDRRALGTITLPTGAAAAIYAVTFHDGARTHWHRHAGGQLLYVVEGAGRTAVRGADTVALRPGDLVEAGPGEEHWHGAAEGSELTHVAVTYGETSWGEAVVER